MRFRRLKQSLLLLITLLMVGNCSPARAVHGAAGGARSLVVTATAYNSLSAQTGRRPSIGAWGDHLKPGMKVIAVSRDLLRLGLTHNSRVTIDGLPGVYRVQDKMNKRWRRKIDIYMGRDVRAARRWGKRRVTIRWRAG